MHTRHPWRETTQVNYYTVFYQRTHLSYNIESKKCQAGSDEKNDSLIFFVISRKREKVDEFSNEIMRSVKEVVLDMGLNIVSFSGVFAGLIKRFDKYAIFNLKISIPWHSILLILAGLGYCSIYIGYIIILKKRTSKYDVEKDVDNEENPNVQD